VVVVVVAVAVMMNSVVNTKDLARYDIFNCNWVATRWKQYSTHLHTNNT